MPSSPHHLALILPFLLLPTWIGLTALRSRNDKSVVLYTYCNIINTDNIAHSPLKQQLNKGGTHSGFQAGTVSVYQY